MPEKHKLYVIAGCNGAGKTTASFTILPEILNCKEFVNADEIARGLSPFQPEKVAIEAGKIMLNRMRELFTNFENFAFETTLASKSYRSMILEAQANDYDVTLLFFWLKSVELAIQRVKIRVEEGGHHIEKDIIERRYKNGIINLFKLYLPIVDSAMIFDNSEGKHDIIAEKRKNREIEVLNEDKFAELKQYFHETERKK
jgi:predicted ABC-type ATPase